jgi:hypothetical protein
VRSNTHSHTDADNDRTDRRSWHEWEVNDGERRIILCVATALELRPGFPGFDANELDRLIEDAAGMMRTSPSPIDAIRIIPERG